MAIMNDLEWPMLSCYVIYYEKFIKIMQWTEKEALTCILSVKAVSLAFIEMFI